MRRVSLPTFLWIAYTVFIVYATTIPFNIIGSKAQLEHHVGVISWKPFYNTDQQEYFSRSDIITNILFFIPFGVFGGYSMQRRSTAAWYAALRAGVLGVCLSAFVEFLQLFTVDRNTSTTDLITNGTGAIIGVVISFLVKASILRGWYVRHAAKRAKAASLFPFLGIGFLTLASSCAPFDFLLSRYRIMDEVGALLGGFSFAPTDMKEFFNSLYFFTLFSLSCALVMREWSFERFRFRSATVSAVLGAAGALSQLFIGSRSLGWGTCCGVVSGIVLGLMFITIVNRKKSPAIYWPALVSAVFLLVSLNFAGPIARSTSLGDILIRRAPTDDALQSLSNFIQITSLFVPVGFLLAYLGSSLRKMYMLLMTVFLVPAIALVIFFGIPRAVSMKHAAGTLVLAQSGVFLGVAACLWLWPIFTYFIESIERTKDR